MVKGGKARLWTYLPLFLLVHSSLLPFPFSCFFLFGVRIYIRSDTVNILARELGNKGFPEVDMYDFYRDIFPVGELDRWRDFDCGDTRDEDDHKYCGIIEQLESYYDEEKKVWCRKFKKRYTLTDDLLELDNVSENPHDFFIIAPISYIGKKRITANARFMYALAIDIDDIATVKRGDKIIYQGINELVHEWKHTMIPQPTYVVASGTGLHLYYVFKKAVPMYKNIRTGLAELKRDLTWRIWNQYVTNDPKKIQQESVMQGFRAVGGATKQAEHMKDPRFDNGEDLEYNQVTAFKTGEKIDIEYLNSFASEECRCDIAYKRSKLSLEDAARKYTDWYIQKVIRRMPRGQWICKRDLYDWWKRKITLVATVGHRYYCMLYLVVFALKCNISAEEVRKDCMELVEIFDSRSETADNRFTVSDVNDALKALDNRDLVRTPIGTISIRTAIPIQRSKRNFRKQSEHMQYMLDEKERMLRRNEPFKNPEGRPSAVETVIVWREAHPTGTKAECRRSTGLSKTTVYRHWDVKREDIEAKTKKDDIPEYPEGFSMVDYLNKKFGKEKKAK